MDPQILLGVLLTAMPLVLSLCLHEFAHARTALAFGDPTAKSMGRCTLNPLAHLDVMGTIMLFVAGFGWAKPVPVNRANLSPPRLGDIAVSAAGPLANFSTALACVLALRLMAHLGVTVDPAGGVTRLDLAVFLLATMVIVNLGLMVFNLIPLLPLDGHHIMREMLPRHLRGWFMQWQVRFGMVLLLVLVLGPRIASGLLRVDVPSPLGWYFRHAIGPMLEHLLGIEASAMAFTGLFKCRHLVLWL